MPISNLALPDNTDSNDHGSGMFLSGYSAGLADWRPPQASYEEVAYCRHSSEPSCDSKHVHIHFHPPSPSPTTPVATEAASAEKKPNPWAILIAGALLTAFLALFAWMLLSIHNLLVKQGPQLPTSASASASFAPPSSSGAPSTPPTLTSSKPPPLTAAPQQRKQAVVRKSDTKGVTDVARRCGTRRERIVAINVFRKNNPDLVIEGDRLDLPAEATCSE